MKKMTRIIMWKEMQKQGPVVCASREEVLQALNENRKSTWSFRSINRVDCY